MASAGMRAENNLQQNVGLSSHRIPRTYQPLAMCEVIVLLGANVAKASLGRGVESALQGQGALRLDRRGR